MTGNLLKGVTRTTQKNKGLRKITNPWWTLERAVPSHINEKRAVCSHKRDAKRGSRNIAGVRRVKDRDKTTQPDIKPDR